MPLLAFALLGVSLVGTGKVLAQNATGQYPPIVQKLADKFGLNIDDVKAVFDQDRQDRQAQMQTRFEEQLSQDVKDGKITEDQKQLIIAKRKELEANRQSNMESMKNMTVEERKAAMEKERTEFESWAKENGIDIKYLFGEFKGHPGGFRGDWKK